MAIETNQDTKSGTRENMERIQTSEGQSLRQDPSKHAHDPNSIQMALGNEPEHLT